MLPMLAADAHTRVIVLYMEGISDGRRFVETAREVTRVKPVIALKVGRFESGQKAAASHTGALAASDTAFEAAFEKAGILRADSAGQMFDWARALENCPLPRGKRIGILTNAGGPGVIAADAIENNGLHLAKLNDSTLKELSANLPPAASVQNPVDMLASASPGQYAACLRLLLEDDNVDGVMVILPPPPMFKAEDAARKVIGVIGDFNKPVVVSLMGSKLVEDAADEFQAAGVPTYPFPERAASALSALGRRAEFSKSRKNPKALETFRVSEPKDNGVEELVAAYGIPTAPVKLARNGIEAAAIAQELGFPVVLKIASPDILHKSDVGGVLLNVRDIPSLESGYTQIISQVNSAKPGARIEGVHIQRQIPQGQDVIVGMVRDPQFGPLMMFGSGGVEVEGLRDVAFALGPLNRLEVREMMRKTWAGRKLKGYRNIPAVDQDAVIDVLIGLSHLADGNENVEEIEINPLRVLERGAVAVDVRVKFR
jgi:acetyltransferase